MDLKWLFVCSSVMVVCVWYAGVHKKSEAYRALKRAVFQRSVDVIVQDLAHLLGRCVYLRLSLMLWLTAYRLNRVDSRVP